MKPWFPWSAERSKAVRDRSPSAENEFRVRSRTARTPIQVPAHEMRRKDSHERRARHGRYAWLRQS